MSPELKVLTINAVFLAYAYLWAYPALTEKTMRAIMTRDMAISCAAVVVAGAIFWGTGVSFSLVLFDANWFVFSALTLMIMETPLFLWFAKKHGLSFDDL